MKTRALGRLLTATLAFSAVALAAITGNTQIPTPTANWVNIKDPKFGATGDGVHDDTAAIQAAIDYAFANGSTAVYCPVGNYKTSNTIWLDPPNNMRATYWTGTGYISGTTFKVSSTTANSLAVGDYVQGAGVTPATTIVGGSNPTWTVNNSQTVGSSGSPIALTANNPSNPTQFGFSMSFFGDPAGGSGAPGCKLRSTFNNAVAFMAGTGQGMRVSDFAMYGPYGGYRGNQSPFGVGIGLSGGNGGSHVNLVENVDAENFYALYETDANGGCCLNDGNTFRKAQGENGYYGIKFNGTQTDMNDVVEPNISDTTIAIDDEVSRPVNVFGGYLASSSARSNSFSISSTSSLSTVSNSQGTTYTFTTTIALPDIYIPNVYNSYTIATAHFGVVPLTMTGWNSGTSVGTFQIWTPWVVENYGGGVGSALTQFQSDIQAASMIYAAERLVTLQGQGISANGIHLENGGCTSLLIAQAGWGGSTTEIVKNPYFNFDPSNPSGTAAQYCQRVFPFIGQEGGGGGTITLEGGNYSDVTPSARVLIEAGPFEIINGKGLNALWLNESVYDTYATGQLGGYGQFPTNVRGIGTWDNDYFLPAGINYSVKDLLFYGEMTAPFCGFEPCVSASPQLSQTNFVQVCPGGNPSSCGTLGLIGTYPPVACRTIFKEIDWNSGALAHLYIRSASCPGFSWGQNLTNATTGGTVTWSYMAGSDVLYLDAKSLSFMFPGLGLSINNGGGPVTYNVLGIFPDLGYVTVSGTLQGTTGTVYSCSSSCTIGQASFAWTAY